MNSYCSQRSCSIESKCNYYPSDVRIAKRKEPKQWFYFEWNFDLLIMATEAMSLEEVIREEGGI
jgi:hypothetical protein